MVRFLKKLLGRSPKPVPEDPQAHQTANVDTKSDRQAEGEYRVEKIIEFDKADKTDWDTAPDANRAGVLGSQNRTEGPRINSFPPRMLRLRLPGTMVATQVSAVG